MSASFAESILRELRIQLRDEVEEQLEPYRRDDGSYASKLLRLLLSADLSAVVKKGSLPADMLSMHKLSLKGVHLLQLLEAEDVSRSRHRNRFYFSSSSEKMQGVCVSAPSKNRMMRLVLTDGTSVCLAMEYRHLPELDEFVRFWCEHRAGVEERRVPAAEAGAVHIVVLLAGEPEIKRGVLLLAPGMLTFVKHQDLDLPAGSSLLSGNRLLDRRHTETAQGSLDIRSYSNFVVSGAETCSGRTSGTISDSDSLGEDELLLRRLDLEDGSSGEREGSDSSSVVEVVSRPAQDDRDEPDGYADVEIREDLECQDEDFGQVEEEEPGRAQRELVVWVEAAVLSSRRSEDDEELFLDLGIHYPVPLPHPWAELLRQQSVRLTRKVAERILSVEGDGESSNGPASGLSMDNLVLLVRFIRGNICLSASLDCSSSEPKGEVDLIGFIPT